MTKSTNDASERTRRHRHLGGRPVRFTLGPQQFITKGLPRFDLQDPYYFAVSLSWKKFALFFLAAEFSINTLFATLYMLEPTSIANQPKVGFASAFFFSLETLATVGYGEMYPATTYGHIISSIEIVTGTVFTAIMTGLLFIRFSKPKAKMVYATHPVIAMQNGVETLMLRMGSTRASVLHNANISLHMLTRIVTDEGQQQVNIVELPLIRSHMPVFVVLFTLRHVIDETSPLYEIDVDSEDFEAIRLFVTISARDPAIGQEVTDIHSFVAPDIRFGMRYVDAVHAVTKSKTVADYSLLSKIEPDITSPARTIER